MTTKDHYSEKKNWENLKTISKAENHMLCACVNTNLIKESAYISHILYL